MTLDQQIALAKNTQRMCRSANTPDAEDWTHVIDTLQKHKRAQEIMTELEQDFREMSGLSMMAKGMKAGAIAVAKWSRFLEMGRIFLNI
jgi:hypothetical protein